MSKNLTAEGRGEGRRSALPSFFYLIFVLDHCACRGPVHLFAGCAEDDAGDAVVLQIHTPCAAGRITTTIDMQVCVQFMKFQSRIEEGVGIDHES
jgi:hypothetical protein